MKLNFTLTLSIALLFFGNCKAQDATIGFQSGAIINIYGGEGSSLSGFGFGLGMSGIIPIGESWAFRPEVNFQKRNFKDEYSYSSVFGNYSYESTEIEKNSMSYIDIPFLFQYTSSGKFGFYFGPQFGLNIGQKIKNEYSYKEVNLSTGEELSGSGTSESKYEGGLKEASIAIGPTYTFDSGLAIEMRAQRSIIIFQDGDNTTDYGWTLLQLGLRYNL